MRAIATLYPEVIQIVARGDGNIRTFSDLKGMKVGVGAPGSGTEANFRQLLDVYGLTKDDVKGQYLSFLGECGTVQGQHIDAFFVVAGVPNAAIMDVAVMQSIRILSVPDDKVAQLTKNILSSLPRVCLQTHTRTNLRK